MKARRSSLLSVVVLAVALVPVPALSAPAAAAPEGRSEAPAGRSEAPAGQVTFAVHVSLAPTWFDPAETPGVITPFMMLFAPIMEPALLIGVGSRLGELPTIAGHPYLSPYEDLKLKGR